jgi:hypothetical protein
VTEGLACISCVRAEVAAMAGELTQISYLVASHRDRWAAIINSRQGSREVTSVGRQVKLCKPII